MRSDVNYSHSKNIGEQVGNFCDVPILTYDNFELEVDVAVDSMRTVEGNKAMGCSDIPNTAEVLPGQIICADNIVRRTTTAEAVGYDIFKEKNPVKMLVGAGDGAMYNAEENQWYMKEKKLRQSTPEELCAYLNDLPKRRFLSRVETNGVDKLFITDDLLGNRLYSFRYFEGTPGTYIGGDEVRPLDPPQFSLGKNSPTRVIQYFDTGNVYKRTPVELKEWKDEFRCDERYTPTSNVSRATIGGTALFENLKAAIELDKATVEPEIKLEQPQTCEWFPTGEFPCGYPVTHAATKERAGVCDTCYAAREARG
jgi:hypothetical protein